MMQLSKNVLSSVALAAASLCMPIHAVADPAITISNASGDTLGNGPFTLGWSFTANSAITVTALGVFDAGQDGLLEAHDVGIWSSAGTLLGSGTVSAGSGDPLTSLFRYVSISGVTLTAGASYRIGALWNSNLDELIFPGAATGFAAASAINYGDARYVFGGALADPTASAGTDPAYFGANFLFQSANSVPEPASLLLVAMAVAALGAVSRGGRRSKV